MEAYRTSFEFNNGITKTIDIDHASLLDLNKLISTKEMWFKYGTYSINLTNVSCISYSLVDKEKSDIEEDPENEAKSFMMW